MNIWGSTIQHLSCVKACFHKKLYYILMCVFFMCGNLHAANARISSPLEMQGFLNSTYQTLERMFGTDQQVTEFGNFKSRILTKVKGGESRLEVLSRKDSQTYRELDDKLRIIQIGANAKQGNAVELLAKFITFLKNTGLIPKKAGEIVDKIGDMLKDDYFQGLKPFLLFPEIARTDVSEEQEGILNGLLMFLENHLENKPETESLCNKEICDEYSRITDELLEFFPRLNSIKCLRECKISINKTAEKFEQEMKQQLFAISTLTEEYWLILVKARKEVQEAVEILRDALNLFAESLSRKSSLTSSIRNIVLPVERQFETGKFSESSCANEMRQSRNIELIMSDNGRRCETLLECHQAIQSKIHIIMNAWRAHFEPIAHGIHCAIEQRRGITQEESKTYLRSAISCYFNNPAQLVLFDYYRALSEGRSSPLIIPAELELTGKFFERLSLLKLIHQEADFKTTEAGIYYTNPKFAEWVGFAKPEKKPGLTLSEALAKEDLGGHFLNPLETEGHHFGPYKDRMAIYLKNFLTMLDKRIKKNPSVDCLPELRNLLNKILNNESLTPKEKGIVDFIVQHAEAEFNGKTVFIHGQSSNAALISVIVDAIRNHFPHCIKQGKYAADPSKTEPDLESLPKHAMTCASRQEYSLSTTNRTPSVDQGRQPTTEIIPIEPVDKIVKFLVDPFRAMNLFDNYQTIIVGGDQRIPISALLFAVNPSILSNMDTSGSFTLAYLLKGISCVEPESMKILDEYLKSMGMFGDEKGKMKAEKLKDMFAKMIRSSPDGGWLTITLTDDRAKEITWLCHPLGKGIDPNIANCRPHLIDFYRFVMSRVDINHQKYEDIKKLLAGMFGINQSGKSFLDVQARIAAIPELFHNSPECRKERGSLNQNPFDVDEIVRELSGILQSSPSA